MAPPARRPTAGASPLDRPATGTVTISGRTWAALGGAFLVLTLLLGLTAVTLISQRQRTVLLNRQLGALVNEASFALHAAKPVLDAQPASSSTVRSRARSLAALVAQARPLVGQLRARGLPQVVGAAGQLLDSLQQDNRLIVSLDDVGALAADADRSRIIARLGPLLNDAAAESSLIAQLARLAGTAQSLRLLPRAASGLDSVGELVRLARQTLHLNKQSLAVQKATLATGRGTRDIAQQILTVAQQTLAHAASLDSKVGPVP